MTDINIYKTGSDLINFISKRWWIIVLATVMGVATGYFKTPKLKPSPPIFETRLTGETKNISNLSAVNIINTLATSANSHNFKQLAKQLNSEETISKDIKGLSAKAFINEDPIENLNNNVFTVLVNTSNFNTLPAFIQELKHYVNNDPLIKNKGSINISPKFNLPKIPANNRPQSLIPKYTILFFVFGVVIAVLINFIVNVRVYQKENQ
ncbi:MAG: hypothetical protein QNK84_08495 [Flavobacteriales bacterium]